MEVSEVKEIMRRRGITQIELAEKSKIPLQTIRKIFCGLTPHPRIDTMQAIERALGLADNSPLENAKVGETLTDKELRLVRAFRRLLEPMQDIMLEQMEKVAEIDNDGYRKQA